MIWLLLLIGLLFIGFIHLIIPICVAANGKLCKKSTLWWIAIGSGLLGFAVCALMQEEFRCLAGIIQSSFWTIISYFILKKRCFTRHNAVSYQECGTTAEGCKESVDIDIDKTPPQDATESLFAEQLGEEYMPTEHQLSSKTAKTKYCSQCGSIINSVTKKCTGCGKQYFTLSAAQILLFVVLAVLVLVIVSLIIGSPSFDNASETIGSSTQATTMPYYSELGLTYSQYQLAKKISANTKKYCESIAEIKAMVKKATYSEDLKKEKVTEYINELSFDYGQRIILYRIQFPTDDTYNSDIVNYLNERDDISYDDMVFILEELGFAVFEDGTVKW